MHRLKPICRLTAIAVLCVMGVARAGVTLSSAFGGGMVLQQAMPLPIWGWADAGEKVSVRLDQAMQTCTAASLKIPHTGLAATSDLAGNLTNIHPANKKDVGLRLARWALAKDYGRTELVYSGPLFKAMRVEGSRARIFFHHAAGGLKSRDGAALTEFQIAGKDGIFVPAIASIDGETVLVRGDGVEVPARVRLGWHNTANPNLVNAAGLPAFPFHTDNWQGGDGL